MNVTLAYVVCEDGQAPGCSGYVIFQAPFLADRTWQLCPFCGGRLRMATEKERREERERRREIEFGKA